MMSKQVRQLLRENNEMEKLLSEDGRSVMTDIVVYLRCADISDIDQDSLKYCFPEFAPYEGKCRFNGCSHVHEPDCAVRQAVDEKKIHGSRYEDYVAMYREIQERKRY